MSAPYGTRRGTYLSLNKPGCTRSNRRVFPRQPITRQFSTVLSEIGLPRNADPLSTICLALRGSSAPRSTSITVCFTSPERGRTRVGPAGEPSALASKPRLAASNRSRPRRALGFESDSVLRISSIDLVREARASRLGTLHRWWVPTRSTGRTRSVRSLPAGRVVDAVSAVVQRRAGPDERRFPTPEYERGVIQDLRGQRRRDPFGPAGPPSW